MHDMSSNSISIPYKIPSNKFAEFRSKKVVLNFNFQQNFSNFHTTTSLYSYLAFDHEIKIRNNSGAD